MEKMKVKCRETLECIMNAFPFCTINICAFTNATEIARDTSSQLALRIYWYVLRIPEITSFREQSAPTTSTHANNFCRK